MLGTVNRGGSIKASTLKVVAMNTADYTDKPEHLTIKREGK